MIKMIVLSFFLVLNILCKIANSQVQTENDLILREHIDKAISSNRTFDDSQLYETFVLGDIGKANYSGW